MKVGNWIILPVLLGMLSATVWIGYDIWKTTADVPISENGYIALGVGAALSLLAGCGLMALLFYRSRHGSDEPPRENNRLNRK
jgi:predicted membrane metal-binding protein